VPTGKKDDYSLRPAAYWRDRAEEAQTMADSMSDGFARSMMLQIATMYGQLEKRAAAAEAAIKVPLSS
jgi:hypothetical protein